MRNQEIEMSCKIFFFDNEENKKFILINQLFKRLSTIQSFICLIHKSTLSPLTIKNRSCLENFLIILFFCKTPLKHFQQKTANENNHFSVRKIRTFPSVLAQRYG